MILSKRRLKVQRICRKRQLILSSMKTFLTTLQKIPSQSLMRVISKSQPKLVKKCSPRCKKMKIKHSQSLNQRVVSLRQITQSTQTKRLSKPRKKKLTLQKKAQTLPRICSNKPCPAQIKQKLANKRQATRLLLKRTMKAPVPWKSKAMRRQMRIYRWLPRQVNKKTLMKQIIRLKNDHKSKCNSTKRTSTQHSTPKKNIRLSHRKTISYIMKTSG